MKLLLLPLFLTCFTSSNAQILNLKKGQHFSYEYISSSEYGQAKNSGSYKFKNIDFTVLNVSKDNYLLSVTEPLIIQLSGNRIFTTQQPLLQQEKDFEAIANKVISNSTYYVNIDKNANVKSIKGVDSIRNRVLQIVTSEKVPEKGAPHLRVADMLLNDQAFIRLIQTIFPQKTILKLDTIITGPGEFVYHRSTNGEPPVISKVATIDTSILKKNMARDYKTGLILNLFENTETKRNFVSNGSK